jgi:hypothetical protein
MGISSTRGCQKTEVIVKPLITLTLIALFSLCVSAQQQGSEDISLIKPGDRVYADASDAAALFNQNGLKINSVHRSKLEGFFRNVWNAALFKTDKGAFEIVFFPESNQAEKVTVTEKRESKRHIYSFAGQPSANPSGAVINAAYPIQFIAKGKWFIVINDNGKLADLLREILM